MIRFSLVCDNGHDFEGWFSSNADFDAQAERGFVQCPDCGSPHVSKSLMAPSLGKSGGENETTALAMSPDQKQAMAKLRELVKTVKANSEDVGERFPEEARKIHYGEVESRGIFGRASGEEARSLIEEGINVAPLPDFADDAN
ncbi:MAG TPA: DUF1178 family protein [Pararhizobium sp.]|nr:DUF1178 family protein [Pararhizobium sp.]